MSDATPPSNPAPNDPEISPWALAGLGVQFAVALVLFGYVGQWLDRRWDSSPLFLLIGVLGGAGGTFFLSYRRLTAPRSTPRPPDGPAA